MSSTQGAGNLAGRDAMAALAARLMGGAAQAPPSAASKATIPRSVPTPRSSDPPTQAYMPRDSNASPNKSAARATNVKPEPTSQAASPAFAPSHSEGPALQYSADQLKVSTCETLLFRSFTNRQGTSGGARVHVRSNSWRSEVPRWQSYARAIAGAQPRARASNSCSPEKPGQFQQVCRLRTSNGISA